MRRDENPHLIDGEFQSDKYPTTPRGKVPLSVKDVTAQDLLWEYAQRRRAVDAEFSEALETALRAAGFAPRTDAHLTETADRLWGLYLTAVGERYGLGHPPKNFLGNVREKHWPCFQQAFAQWNAERDSARAEVGRLRGALTKPPTSQEIQVACLAYGGNSFAGPVREALTAFLEMRRAALQQKE